MLRSECLGEKTVVEFVSFLDPVGKDGVKLFTEGAALCVEGFVGEPQPHDDFFPSLHLERVVCSHLCALLLRVDGIFLTINQVPSKREREREGRGTERKLRVSIWLSQWLDNNSMLHSCPVNHTHTHTGRPQRTTIKINVQILKMEATEILYLPSCACLSKREYTKQNTTDVVTLL